MAVNSNHNTALCHRVYRPLSRWLYAGILAGVLLLSIIPERISAQWYLNENLIFAFGNYAGLDFRSGSPVVIPTEVSGIPYSTRPPRTTVTGWANASVCDKNGNLLFYTNGSHIWDRSHSVMTNAYPLHNSNVNVIGYTQAIPHGTLIVPFINDTNQYYVFSQITPSSSGDVFYSVVDMRLNGGMGNVVPGQKWMRIGRGMSGSMISIPGNDCNVWVVLHSRDSNLFHVYDVRATGLNVVPQIQQVGTYGVVPPFVPGGPTPAFWRGSFMNASPDGKRLVFTAENGSIVEMFDFDGYTGQISNPQLVDTGNRPRSAVFSPDNSKLYVVANRNDGTPYQGIYQFDATLPDIHDMRASKMEVGTCNVMQTDLKLAVDGKIYFLNNRTGNGNPTYSGRDIGVIHFPDRRGPACEFDSFAIKLDTNTIAIYGFANQIVRKNDSVFYHTDTAVCGSIDNMLLSAPLGYNRYAWNDGITTASRSITQRGTYWVHSSNDCIVRTDTFRVGGVEMVVDLGPDILVCENPEPVMLEIPPTDVALRWSDGSTGNQLEVSISGTYWVAAESEGCIFSDTVDIWLTHIPQDLGPDTLFCLYPTYPEASYSLHAHIPDKASARWSTGSNAPTLHIQQTNTYWVEVSDGRCVGSDTVNVEFAYLAVELGNDTTVCNDEPIHMVLSATVVPGATIKWSTGETSPDILINDSGYYAATVTYGTCEISGEVEIHLEACSCPASVPTAFTPNGDGRNDIFRPVIDPACHVTGFHLLVFDRWGQNVYDGAHGSNIKKGWDGTFNGVQLPPGIYMYHIRLESGAKNILQQFKGEVTLIR